VAGLNEKVGIIMRVPGFAIRTNVQAFHKRITDFETYSVYEAMSADAKKAHGLAPSLSIFDDLRISLPMTRAGAFPLSRSAR
jgi:phage terminase large subunit-like protein